MFKTIDQKPAPAKSPVTSIKELADYLELTAQGITEMEKTAIRYPFQVSAYTLSLMDPKDENCPIRRQFLPDTRELCDKDGMKDPLLEDQHLVAKRVIKVYPERVAVIFSDKCASLCRFCFRKTLWKNGGSFTVSEAEREEALAYISRDKTIRDALVTGGDPLMLSDSLLERFLKKLRAIKHVETIRIGTRLLSTGPERITPALAAILAKFHPLWLNLHFNHPRELTQMAATAADHLLSRGIPLSNQTVLLRGVNDDLETMKSLSRGLLRMRVRPYYLFQCHLVEGTAHFRTALETGQTILRGLRGRISGLGIPLYTVDTPYGKVPVNPNYLLGRQGNMVRMKTYAGHLWQETNPPE